MDGALNGNSMKEEKRKARNAPSEVRAGQLYVGGPIKRSVAAGYPPRLRSLWYIDIQPSASITIKVAALAGIWRLKSTAE